MIKHLKFLLAILALFSIAGFGEVGYYQIKATVAQMLLQKAWSETQQKLLANPLISSQQNIRPWPWADTWPLFKLKLINQQKSSKANREQSEFIVLADASGESLAFGPGLLTPDLLPGDIGNSMIAAHRDTHFADLGLLSIDDVMTVELKDGREIEFVIDQIIIVDSNQQAPILESSVARLTLVTCYPFEMSAGQTSLRYLVSGQTTPTPSIFL